MRLTAWPPSSATKPAGRDWRACGFCGRRGEQRRPAHRRHPPHHPARRAGGSAIAATIVNGIVELATREGAPSYRGVLGSVEGKQRGITTSTCAAAAAGTAMASTSGRTAADSLASCSPKIVVPVLLNCFLFVSLGVFIALIVRTHRDMGAFTSFVIVPMSFLSNTFFSLERLPPVLQTATRIIPLTHASIAVCGAFLGRSISGLHYLVLVGYALLFFWLAVRQVHHAVE